MQENEITPFDGYGVRPENSEVGCFQCGLCCRLYKIFISPEEADLIARRTGLSIDEVAEFQTDLAWFGEENLFLLKNDNGCIFLKEIPGTKRALCGIHEFKPQVCRKFQASFDKPICQQGLAEVWGLIVGRSGHVEGPETNIAEFFAVLKEING